MPIVVNLDVMMAKRRMSSGELANLIGLSQANLSILKTGKARAVRFSTLEAICKALNCQPGEILEYSQEAPAHGTGSPTPAGSADSGAGEMVGTGGGGRSNAEQ